MNDVEGTGLDIRQENKTYRTAGASAYIPTEYISNVSETHNLYVNLPPNHLQTTKPLSMNSLLYYLANFAVALPITGRRCQYRATVIHFIKIRLTVSVMKHADTTFPLRVHYLYLV